MRYSKPTDKRLVAEIKAMSGKHGEYQPVKVWSPDGEYWVATAATHEEFAGSMVADGISKDEYWPMVVDGYRASVRGYIKARKADIEAQYRAGWVGRILEHMADNA